MPNETELAPNPPATETTATPPVDPQTQARADVYKKYYDTSAPPPVDGETKTTTESVAQTEQPVQETTPTEVTTEATPDPRDVAILELKQQLADLAAKVNPPPPKPAEPAKSPEDQTWLNDWLELARTGKIREAEQFLIAKVRDAVVPDAVGPAVARSREVARAEAEVERFVTQLRSDNPDLLPLEGYITHQAEQTLNRLRAENKITSTDQFVEEYKKAVNSATSDARKLAQTLRGSGKQEAMTRNREVISTSTVAPSGVDLERRATQQTEESQTPEPIESYFEKRRAAANKARGLGE